MKETGVVRRIDELGRIVIPKEIRKRLRVGPGDMLDIYTDEDSITLKKYSVLDDFFEGISDVAKALKSDERDFIVANGKDIVVSTTNEASNGDELSKDFLKLFLKNQALELGSSKTLAISEGFIPERNIYAKKIFKDGDLVAIVIMLGKGIFMKTDKEMVLALERYIQNYIS